MDQSYKIKLPKALARSQTTINNKSREAMLLNIICTSSGGLLQITYPDHISNNPKVACSWLYHLHHYYDMTELKSCLTIFFSHD